MSNVTNNEKPTIVPSAYPALEQEVYLALDTADSEHPTVIPAAGDLESLVLECGW